MKLLRDFFRLRTAGRFSLAGRRRAVRVIPSVTVPQPLNKQAESPRTSRHLHLVSSL